MKKPRFSLGSIVMLLATLFVVIGMAAFLTLIAGDGVYERTRAVFGLLADQTEEATATPTGVPTASPMPEITEGPTPSPSPTATPALEPKTIDDCCRRHDLRAEDCSRKRAGGNGSL